jgi:hypothetical protein
MSTIGAVAQTYLQIPDSVAAFAHEAECALSALYHSVRERYGEKAAFSVAEEWLENFDQRIEDCKNAIPAIREITLSTIAASLAPVAIEKSAA